MYGNFSASFSSFNNNSARNGGAIFIDNSTSANFMRNIFTNNRAADTGGAIFNVKNDNLKTVDCRFMDNSPEDIY